MAKWKQMKMIVGSIMVGALLMPTMSITCLLYTSKRNKSYPPETGKR